MQRRLCAAILLLQAVVLGLTTPVLITVQSVDKSAALLIGPGLTVLCLAAAGLLRSRAGYLLGWSIQIATVALGLEVTAMYVLGVVFLALWIAAYRLGAVIDAHEADAEAQVEPRHHEEASTPDSWDHELVCEPDTWRPYAHDSFRALWTVPARLGFGAGLVLAVVILLTAPGARVLGCVLLAAVACSPVFLWLTQMLSWRKFLGSGRIYRTSFAEDRLFLWVDGTPFDIRYDEITTVTTKPGLVSATLAQQSTLVELPAAVFPPDEVERVRRAIGATH